VLIAIHVFLVHSHTNIHNGFRLGNPVFDMDTHISKVTVITKRG